MIGVSFEHRLHAGGGCMKDVIGRLELEGWSVCQKRGVIRPLGSGLVMLLKIDWRSSRPIHSCAKFRVEMDLAVAIACFLT